MAKAKKEEKTGLSDELQAAIKALNDSYGAGSLGLIEEAPKMVGETIPTGSLILDAALGGGWPKSKVIEVFGDESIGKSTLAWHFLAQFPGPKLYCDTEQSLDKEYGERIGVNLSNLIINQPDNLEQGLSIVRELCDKVDAIVFDSVTEAATQRELEGELTDQDIGVKAKIMSKMLRLIKAKEHDSTIFFTSQIRENPGITYGSNRVTSGGKALKFGSHVRIDLYGKELIKRGAEDIIGHYMNIKIVKNKSSAPHVKCQIPIIYDGYGISRELEVIDLCLEKGILVQSGAWIKHGKDPVAQGKENARLFLKDNPEYRQELEKELKAV